MTEIRQSPARVNIILNKRNSLSLVMDWNIDLSSYTFEAKIYNQDKSIDESFTITNVNLSLGQITISLTKEQGLLLEEGIYEWWLDFITSTTRITMLAGNATIYEGI